MDKYLKYKNKYLALKNKYIQQGGSNEYRVYINKKLYDTIIFYQNITLEDDKLKETLLENIDCTKYNIINKLNEDGITVTVDKENNINIDNPNKPTIQFKRGDLHKMDLYLEQELNLKQELNGGGVDANIEAMNISVNKYLVNQEKTIGFEFIGNNKPWFSKPYFAKGGLTAIFKIRNAINYDTTKYILRVIDKNESSDIDNFICKYTQDKELFGKNMIKIYYYGTLYNRDRDSVAYYVITKEYCDNTKMLELDEPRKINLVIQILDFIELLYSHNFVYRDLKFENIGYEELENGSLIFIVLDYDMITLVHTNTFIDTRNHGIVWRYNKNSGILLWNTYVYGSLPPIYLFNYMNNILISKERKIKQDFKDMLNKFACIGIAYIIAQLFNPSSFYGKILFKSFIGFLILSVNEFNNLESSKTIWTLKSMYMYKQIKSVNSLDPREQKIFNLLLKLSDFNYKDVPTTEQTKCLFLQCFN